MRATPNLVRSGEVTHHKWGVYINVFTINVSDSLLQCTRSVCTVSEKKRDHIFDDKLN